MINNPEGGILLKASWIENEQLNEVNFIIDKDDLYEIFDDFDDWGIRVLGTVSQCEKSIQKFLDELKKTKEKMQEQGD